MAKGKWVFGHAIDCDIYGSIDGKTLAAAVRKAGQKTIQVSRNPEVKEDILWYIRLLVAPYVPRETGHLVNSAEIRDDKLYYSAVNTKNGYDYAERQYFDTTLEHHTLLERDHWLDVVMPGGEMWGDLVEFTAQRMAEELSKEK